MNFIFADSTHSRRVHVYPHFVSNVLHTLIAVVMFEAGVSVDFFCYINPGFTSYPDMYSVKESEASGSINHR
jgi:hypothetical protein